MAWMTWGMGLPLPGDEGDKYFPQGYRIGEIGPRCFMGKGDLRERVEELKKKRTGECPFGRVKGD